MLASLKRRRDPCGSQTIEDPLKHARSRRERSLVAESTHRKIVSAIPPATYPAKNAASPAETRETATHEQTYRVSRRNGSITPFDPQKIRLALTKAFLAIEGETAAGSSRLKEQGDALTHEVTTGVTRSLPTGGAAHIEDIQDYVELALKIGRASWRESD